ncbi:MAG TPA: hypothetical protein VF756_14395 [Thermoanaerobaculia bacterium]
MLLRSRLLPGALFLAMTAGAVAPSSATTLIRQSLDGLVAKNATIVVGEVLDAHSYWNEAGTFIFTDVRVKATDVLKGDPRDTEFTVTLMGGSVGDLTTLIVAGAELVPGKPYVLFLDEGSLPGVERIRTVRDHSQGVFEVVRARDGLRAISQANRHPLYPDALGFVDPPGEAKGLLLNDMIRSIREIASRQDTRREVQ